MDKTNKQTCFNSTGIASEHEVIKQQVHDTHIDRSIDQQVVHSLLCTDNNEGSHCKRCGVSCMLCHGNTV